jgi:dsDNA-specific endonuclease/ATPase MutS2
VSFSDTLREWEAARAARGTRREDPAARALVEWLDRHPPAPEAGREDAYCPSAAERSAELCRLRPEATLDLHGLRAEEVSPALERFVSASRRQGLRKVLIIHGKGKHSQGEPVLRGLVRGYLERSPHTGAFGPADPRLGGSGAVWVTLRPRPPRQP